MMNFSIWISYRRGRLKPVIYYYLFFFPILRRKLYIFRLILYYIRFRTYNIRDTLYLI